MSAPLWQPSEARARASQITQFMAYVSHLSGATIENYTDLHSYSIEQPEHFWAAVWRFCGVRAETDFDQVLVNGNKMPGAQWFPDAKLNFAANLLRHRGPEAAIIFRGENGQRRTVSRDQLWREVAAIASGLRRAGVKPGDRVAAYMPNIPETVSVMLASASLGATFSSCSPDFGVSGVLDRFGQIAPKVLFVVDGYYYNGKKIMLNDRLASIMPALPTVEKLVIVPFVDQQPDTNNVACASIFEDFCQATDEITFASLPFDHPLYILYSSGTTGVPKCIVHGAGGTLLQHLKELILHTDLGPMDRIFYFTTCGWMMWNWLASSLATGATIVLYDGSPMHPDPSVLWRMAEEEKVTVFGTSAKYLASIAKAGLIPADQHNLDSLRTVLSTGSPLLPQDYDYVYQAIGSDLQLSSISGGTDIVSCFALGNPILPVYAGQIQCRGLGMAVEIFDENGHSLNTEKGELVCTKPFPSMPLGFWNDPDGSRYQAAYFDRFDNAWCHGDYAALTKQGGVIIYGRSDAVLNPGGVRIGTAEIYRQVDRLDQVIESIAVGQDWQGDQRIILFVRLAPGQVLDQVLEQKIRQVIRSNTTPRHVPAKIFAVDDIPRTRSGKTVELAVQSIIHGRQPTNTASLANPESLQLYRNVPGLSAD